jgi:predicted ATPase
LDGLPLAIEVAASWMRGLSTEEVYLQLERNPDFLNNPLRDAPGRHRTLWATLDWRR